MVSYHGKERAGEGGREEGREGSLFYFSGKERRGKEERGVFESALSSSSSVSPYGFAASEEGSDSLKR